MNFIWSSNVSLLMVKYKGFESCVFKTISEWIFGVNFMTLEKKLSCLIWLIAVRSPSPNSWIHPVYQSVASNSKGSFFVSKNVINSSLSFKGKLLASDCVRQWIREVPDFDLKLVVNPTMVKKENKISQREVGVSHDKTTIVMHCVVRILHFPLEVNVSGRIWNPSQVICNERFLWFGIRISELIMGQQSIIVFWEHSSRISNFRINFFDLVRI